MSLNVSVPPVSPIERSCLNKHRYWSQVDALIMADRCIERRSLKGLAAYACCNCGGWHLTRRC
jgi:hypothetical protein